MLITPRRFEPARPPSPAPIHEPTGENCRGTTRQPSGLHRKGRALTTTAAVGFAAADRPADARTPIKRVGPPKLKTSLNAYSFSKTLNDQLKGRAKGVSLF